MGLFPSTSEKKSSPLNSKNTRKKVSKGLSHNMLQKRLQHQGNEMGEEKLMTIEDNEIKVDEESDDSFSA